MRPLTPNPGGVVAADDLVGRIAELQRLHEAVIHGGAHVRGERRMGKTSVLRKLAKDLEDVALPDDSPINDLAQIDIGPLREPEATTLIERLLLGIGAEPDQALITRIFVETSGIPFYAQAVIDQLRYEPPGVDITHLVDRMIVENTWHTDHYVTRIEEYYGKADEPLVLAVLDAIATSDAVLSPDELLRRIPTERPPSRDKLLRLLPMLEKDHYLTRVGVGDRFSSDLQAKIWRLHRRLA